jgi:hypothetical protein
MKTIKNNGKTYQKTIAFGNQAKRTIFENVKKQRNKMQCRIKDVADKCKI